MQKVADFFKAVALVTVAIGALIAGPILALIAIAAFAIAVAFLIIKDHREDTEATQADRQSNHTPQ